MTKQIDFRHKVFNDCFDGMRRAVHYSKIYYPIMLKFYGTSVLASFLDTPKGHWK